MTESAEATGPSRRRRSAVASSVVGAVIGGICVVFVARELVSEWDRVSDAVTGAEPGWLGAGLMLAGAAMASIAWCWGDALAVLGARRPRRTVVAWYFLGELGKYLPGGVWPVLGRGELARRGGVNRATAYGSVILSLLALYLGALLVAAVLVPVDLARDDGPRAAFALLVLLPIGLALLHHRVLDGLLGWVRRRTGRAVELVVPRWRTTIGLIVRYVPAWLLIGGATWCVARALTPDAPVARIALAAVLSWIAGFVAVPVPAGAGVREAVFVAVAGLPGAIAATVAVAARVVFIVVDGAGAAVAVPLRRSGPGADEPGPGPPPVAATGTLDRRPEGG